MTGPRSRIVLREGRYRIEGHSADIVCSSPPFLGGKNEAHCLAGEKIREHIAQLQAQVASASRDSTPADNQSETYDNYSYPSSSSRPHFTPLKQEHPSPSNLSRIPREHDPSHMHDDQNVLTQQWNGAWSYFPGSSDIFDNVYPPTPPQEFSQHNTSPIICSALPRPSDQPFPRPQKPTSHSPRPAGPVRSMTSPQLPLSDKCNRTWTQPSPNGLAIKWGDSPASAAFTRAEQDPHMPQLSYLPNPQNYQRPNPQGQCFGWPPSSFAGSFPAPELQRY